MVNMDVVCLHPGERLENGTRIYLPQTFAERTHSAVLDAAKIADAQIPLWKVSWECLHLHPPWI